MKYWKPPGVCPLGGFFVFCQHAKDDEIIKGAAQLIKKCLCKEDILARLGGDEFVALMPNTHEKTAAIIAKRIKMAIADYDEASTDLPLSFSLGVATSPAPAKSLEEVLKWADKRMYDNKRQRNNSLRE